MSFQNLLMSKQITLPTLTWSFVKVGVRLRENNVDFLVNNLIVLCKSFIHKCKYLKARPRIIGFLNNLALFKKSLHLVKTEKAQKLSTLLDSFALLD